MQNKVFQVTDRVIMLHSDTVTECVDGKWVAAGLTAYDNLLGARQFDSPIDLVVATLDEYVELKDIRPLGRVSLAICETLVECLGLFKIIAENHGEIFGDDDDD